MNSGFYSIPKNRTYQPSTSPYKVYTALLTQTGTDAPTAIILENTLGAITYEYYGPGFYTILSSNLFTLNKTFVLIGNKIKNKEGELTQFTIEGSTSHITIITTNEAQSKTNNLLANTPIEIRVYN